jgi:hypothetical protein
MGNRRLDEVLYEVGADTLGGLALMLLVPEEEATATGPQPMKAASVAFAGPFSGEVVVSASATLLPHLAANMLGLEDASASTPAQQEDALGELANVVCGNLLSAIAGPKPVFRVSVPHRVADDRPTEAAESRRPAAGARLFLDVGRVELTLYTNEPIAVGAGA